MFKSTNTRLGDDPNRVIIDAATEQEHRLGDLAKRTDKVGDIARLVLAIGKVDCPGCNQRRRAARAYVELPGKPTTWLCNDCHDGLRRSRKRFKQVVANLDAYAARSQAVTP